ncbi:MAG: DUF805 domain-containing protein, partial [Cyanobium sp.]
MLDAYLSGWKQSFDYEGRASRPDFWWFVLSNFIALFLLGIVAGFARSAGVGLYIIYLVAQIFPSLALTIRRLRDSGKVWPWIFIQLVPLVGPIWLIVLLA